MRFKAMTDIKGDRLCVNLGASQVRRRLKGYGFGVRKVFSDGAGLETAHSAHNYVPGRLSSGKSTENRGKWFFGICCETFNHARGFILEVVSSGWVLGDNRP